MISIYFYYWIDADWKNDIKSMKRNTLLPIKSMNNRFSPLCACLTTLMQLNFIHTHLIGIVSEKVCARPIWLAAFADSIRIQCGQGAREIHIHALALSSTYRIWTTMMAMMINDMPENGLTVMESGMLDGDAHMQVQNLGRFSIQFG